MKHFNKAELLKRLGAWIAKLRKSRGIGQDALTAQAGLARGTVSKIENGLVDPRVITVVKLAHALEVSPGVVIEPQSERVLSRNH